MENTVTFVWETPKITKRLVKARSWFRAQTADAQVCANTFMTMLFT